MGHEYPMWNIYEFNGPRNIFNDHEMQLFGDKNFHGHEKRFSWVV